MAHVCEDLSTWTTVAKDGQDGVDSNPATSATSDAPAQDNCDRVVNEPPGDLQADHDHAMPKIPQEDAKADDVVNESPSEDPVDHATQEPAHEVHEDPHAVDNQSAVSDASWERVECAAGDNPPIDQGSFPRSSKNLLAVFVGVLSVGMAGMAATAHSMCGSIDPTMQGAKVEIMKKLVPFGTSRCFESALDSCILQFNGTVIDSPAKQGYFETWQDQGFPPINCHDLGSEIWVSGFPQNCEGAWSDFGPCSASCGDGTRSTAFQITRPAQNGGAPCHEKNQLKTEKCNDQPCPVDCVLHDWQPDVSGCSKLCGNGTVKETREVQHDASHGGDCPHPASDQRERWIPCNVDPCPVALMEGLQSSLVATGQTVESIRQTTDVSRTLNLELLQNHPVSDCTAGLTEDMTDAAAACEKNNLVAVKIREMSPVLEQVQDDCGLIVPFFREVVNSLKWDLNALFKHACSGNAESGETTLSLLDEHIKGLLNQIEVCRTHSKTLKAKNEDLISSRIGYGQDAERRSGKLLAELKSLELEEPSLKSELLSRAGVMEETKQILETKKEDLKRSGRQLDDLKQQQLHGLSIDQAAADDATSKAGEARQHAENLESSLKGKQRSENLELQAAKKEAEDLEDQAQQKTADYTAKLKEYNQAAANLESTVKADEEAVRKHMQSIAENQKMSDEVRSRQVQVGKMILDKYLETRNLNRFQHMSEVSKNQVDLDSRLADATQTLQGLSMKFKFVRDYLESLKREGRMKTGPGACDEARNVALNIFHSVREVVHLG